MPTPSVTATAHIQQLFNRVNDLLRLNTQGIRDEANAAANSQGAARQAHLARLRQLRQARREILAQHDKVFELEIAYEASNREPGDAEARLVAGTRDANALVRSIQNAADLLNKVADFANLLARLVAVFT